MAIGFGVVVIGCSLFRVREKEKGRSKERPRWHCVKDDV
jgi:hypothetical protein